MSKPQRMSDVYGKRIKQWLEETKPPKDPSHAAMAWQMNQFLMTQMPRQTPSTMQWPLIFPMYYQNYCGIPLVKVPDSL